MTASLRRSLWLGAGDSVSFFVSTFLFGILFGAAAAAAGITLWQALLMSGAVFSASAQFAALEFWQTPLPLFTIALSVLLVSARNVLLGMAMTHHLDGHSLGRRLLWLALLTDPGVVSTLRQQRAMDKLGYLTGYGMALWASWLLSTAIGYLAASNLALLDTERLRFAGPMVMATMLMLFARGNARQLPSWILAGVVAITLVESGSPAWLVLPLAVLSGAVFTLGRESLDAG
jgi:predicted branched-subunit amino acid permease